MSPGQDPLRSASLAGEERRSAEAVKAEAAATVLHWRPSGYSGRNLCYTGGRSIYSHSLYSHCVTLATALYIATLSTATVLHCTVALCACGTVQWHCNTLHRGASYMKSCGDRRHTGGRISCQKRPVTHWRPHLKTAARSHGSLGYPCQPVSVCELLRAENDGYPENDGYRTTGIRVNLSRSTDVSVNRVSVSTSAIRRL